MMHIRSDTEYGLLLLTLEQLGIDYAVDAPNRIPFLVPKTCTVCATIYCFSNLGKCLGIYDADRKEWTRRRTVMSPSVQCMTSAPSAEHRPPLVSCTCGEPIGGFALHYEGCPYSTPTG